MKSNIFGKILIILAGLLIMAGVYAYTIVPEEEYQEKEEEKALTESEAKIVITGQIKKVLDFYKSPKEYFKVLEENDNDIKVANYSDVVKNLFTNNGIKELESATIDNISYITKNGNDIYVLKGTPENKLHKEEKITLKDYKRYPKLMSATITFEKTYMDEQGTANVIFTTLEVSLVKENNNWLINSFNLNYL